jgi:hypothetical protein
MRPTRIELATFGLKDRRSLVPVKGPLTTELRAHCPLNLIGANRFENCRIRAGIDLA